MRAAHSASVQNIRTAILKQNTKPKKLLQTKVSTSYLEQQNNNEIVTQKRPNVLKYVLKGYDAAVVYSLVA